ncbi:UNVERIFIED_CONTAM: hypothetical protein Slati_0140500 [Sesamum latifolium]|uniref:RNase H type-1 domain-containing protein n=1 Tax=Sesamum latifolium TaxID=2727402 RepID=A0AAW2Y9W7_9LAMI
MHKVSLLPGELLSFALNYLFTYHQINATSAAIGHRLSSGSWSLPGDGVIKLNFDGAMFKASLEIGIGVVAHDSSAACVWWKSVRKRWTPELELVEVVAAREAVLPARRFGWRRIVLEGDCANLHCKLSSPQADCASTGVVTHDIKCLSSAFESCIFSLVRRMANKIAHCLARKASNTGLEGPRFPPLLAELWFSGSDI